MRFITFLRRLDNHKKDTIILAGSLFLTFCIAVGGFLFTQSSIYTHWKNPEKGNATSTLDALVDNAQATIVPTIQDIQKNIDTLSEEYKKGSFSDFFVPKSE